MIGIRLLEPSPPGLVGREVIGQEPSSRCLCTRNVCARSTAGSPGRYRHGPAHRVPGPVAQASLAMLWRLAPAAVGVLSLAIRSTSGAFRGPAAESLPQDQPQGDRLRIIVGRGSMSQWTALVTGSYGRVVASRRGRQQGQCGGTTSHARRSCQKSAAESLARKPTSRFRADLP